MIENCSALIILGIVLLIVVKYSKKMSEKQKKYFKIIGYVLLSIGIVFAFNEMITGVIDGFRDAQQNIK